MRRKPAAAATPAVITPSQVIDELKTMYMGKLRPIEEAYKFGEVG